MLQHQVIILIFKVELYVFRISQQRVSIGTPYIAGWLVGAFILAYSGLLGIDFLIYLIPLGFLVYKLLKRIRD